MHPFFNIDAYTQRACAGERGEREREEKRREGKGKEKKRREKEKRKKEREEIIFLPDRKLTVKEGTKHELRKQLNCAVKDLNKKT